MKTNELKKGDKIIQRNGWKATIEDNQRGNIRLATVHGWFTETGSIYSHDIVAKIECDDMSEGSPYTVIEPIEHTAAQLKLKAQVI